jgi:hypothetical protein
MSASKRKGTGWESAVVNYLRDHGVPHAERRTSNGAHDRGDIAGIPQVIIEAKNCARIELAAWLDEARREQGNADARVGLVWFKRRGCTSPGAGFVLMDGDTLLRLLADAGYLPATSTPAGAAASETGARRDPTAEGSMP